MDDVIKYLVALFGNLWAAASKWFSEAFKGVLDYVTDFFFNILDWVLKHFEDLLPKEMPSFWPDAQALWSGLPSTLWYYINALEIDKACLIIGFAYLIRFTLNLIPSFLTRI